MLFTVLNAAWPLDRPGGLGELTQSQRNPQRRSGHITTLKELRLFSHREKRKVTSNVSVVCSPSEFGGVDPVPGFAKFCYCLKEADTSCEVVLEKDSLKVLGLGCWAALWMACLCQFGPWWRCEPLPFGKEP